MTPTATRAAAVAQFRFGATIRVLHGWVRCSCAGSRGAHDIHVRFEQRLRVREGPDVIMCTASAGNR